MSRAKRDVGSKRVHITEKYLYNDVNRHAHFIRAAGIEPTPGLLESIATYSELLLRWNRKVSLTTITDPEEILERNFVESFCGARWLSGDTGLLGDVGSGAGFPGLALKLVRPHWMVRLFEPNLKKAAFLAEVARELDLAEVEIIRQRWEEAGVAPGSMDAVTARAVGNYEQIAQKARLTLKQRGRLLLWVGRADSERLKAITGWAWESEQLAGSRARILLVGSPIH